MRKVFKKSEEWLAAHKRCGLLGLHCWCQEIYKPDIQEGEVAITDSDMEAKDAETDSEVNNDSEDEIDDDIAFTEDSDDESGEEWDNEDDYTLSYVIDSYTEFIKKVSKVTDRDISSRTSCLKELISRVDEAMSIALASYAETNSKTNDDSDDDITEVGTKATTESDDESDDDIEEVGSNAETEVESTEAEVESTEAIEAVTESNDESDDNTRTIKTPSPNKLHCHESCANYILN